MAVGRVAGRGARVDRRDRQRHPGRAGRQCQAQFARGVRPRAGTPTAGRRTGLQLRAAELHDATQHQQRQRLAARGGPRQCIRELRRAGRRPVLDPAPGVPSLRQLGEQARPGRRQRRRDGGRGTADAGLPAAGRRLRAHAPGQQAPLAVENIDLGAQKIAVGAVVQPLEPLQRARIECGAVPQRQGCSARRRGGRAPGRQVGGRQRDQAVGSQAQQATLAQLGEQGLVFQRRCRHGRHQVAAGRQPGVLDRGAWRIRQYLGPARPCPGSVASVGGAQQLHLQLAGHRAGSTGTAMHAQRRRLPVRPPEQPAVVPERHRGGRAGHDAPQAGVADPAHVTDPGAAVPAQPGRAGRATDHDARGRQARRGQHHLAPSQAACTGCRDLAEAHTEMDRQQARVAWTSHLAAQVDLERRLAAQPGRDQQGGRTALFERDAGAGGHREGDPGQGRLQGRSRIDAVDRPQRAGCQRQPARVRRDDRCASEGTEHAGECQPGARLRWPKL